MLTPDGLSPLEVAAGRALGLAPPLELPDDPGDPLAELQAVVRGSLELAPCTVAFSGGRDSCLVLLAAVRAARAAGLADPVPLTLRYPEVPEADESRWQELVVRHLGLRDWIRIELGDELDLLGLRAREVLRRHGPVFPANAHSLMPLLEAAAGGSLLVGLGGDELLDCHHWTGLGDLLARRRRPAPSDPLRIGLALCPAPLRGAVLVRRDEDGGPPWLRDEARRRLRRALAHEAAEPVRFDRYVARAAADRNLTLAVATLERLGAERGTIVSAPLIDPRFVAALARRGGARGLGARRLAMRAIVDGALPAAVVERTDKAVFTGAFFGPETRAFAQSWSGSGLDGAVVDLERVRAAWAASRPDYRAALLLQSAWLHEDRAAMGAR